MQQKIEIDNYLTNNYMVDIPMCTYNHEKYIAQTIESILMQKTDFKIRLFIGEDCSIDNTRKIVKQYAEKYPDIIFPVYHNENIGAVRNSEILLKKCTAKYIALLDGDDYWTDPYKLQKQVDFLEKNPEYSLCSHRYKINSWNSDYYSGLFKEDIKGIEIDINAFFKYWLIKTLTVVFRRDMFDISIINNYKYFRDVHLFFHLLLKGNGYCMNFIGGVYIKHNYGVHSPNSSFERAQMSYLVFKELYEKNKSILKQQYVNTYSHFIDMKMIKLKAPFLSKAVYSDIIKLFDVSKSYKILFLKFLKMVYYPLKYSVRLRPDKRAIVFFQY